MGGKEENRMRKQTERTTNYGVVSDFLCSRGPQRNSSKEGFVPIERREMLLF